MIEISPLSYQHKKISFNHLKQIPYSGAIQLCLTSTNKVPVSISFQSVTLKSRFGQDYWTAQNYLAMAARQYETSVQKSDGIYAYRNYVMSMAFESSVLYM